MSALSADELSRLHTAFSAELAKSGLSLPPAELETLFEGFCGLQKLLARLPRDLPMNVEPAMVAITDGGRITR